MKITIVPTSRNAASKGLPIYLVMSRGWLESVRGPRSLVPGRQALKERQRTPAPGGQPSQGAEPLLIGSDLVRLVPDDQVSPRAFQEEHIIIFGIRELEDHKGT